MSFCNGLKKTVASIAFDELGLGKLLEAKPCIFGRFRVMSPTL